MYDKLISDYDEGKKSFVIWTATAIVLCAVGFLGSIFTSLPVSSLFFLLGLAGCIAALISIKAAFDLYAQIKRVVLWERIADAPVGSHLEKGLHLYLNTCKQLKEKEEAVVALRTLKALFIHQLEEEAKKQNAP